ncbi:phosphatase PAP2 family protein (plasmid) [Leptospira sp. WS60.C2]
MNVIILAQTSFWFSDQTLDLIHNWDHYFGSVLYPLSVLFHYIGGSVFFLCLVSFIYAYLRPKLAFELAIALLTSGVFGLLTKFYLESPRPFPYPEAYDEKAFGMPSSHVYSSFVVWGLLAYRIPNLLMRFISVFIILFMPFSRMYLKVHFLGDVSLGFVLGAIHLFICILILQKLDKINLSHYFIQSEKYQTLSLLGIVITLSPIVLNSPFLSAEHYQSLSAVLMSSGSLAGFWIGILYYPRFSKHKFLTWSLKFTDDPNFWKIVVIRAIVLLLILILFYVIPGIIIKASILKDDLIIRYLRYMLVTFSLILFFPILMQRIASGKYFVY